MNILQWVLSGLRQQPICVIGFWFQPPRGVHYHQYYTIDMPTTATVDQLLKTVRELFQVDPTATLDMFYCTSNNAIYRNVLLKDLITTNALRIGTRNQAAPAQIPSQVIHLK